jgi:hypothetical protein
MHSPAYIIATSHINELQAEAAANRLAKKAPRRPGRIAAALASLQSLLGSSTPISLPTLTNYPYRS